MVLLLIAAIFVLNAMVPTTWFNKCLASLTIDEKILSAHGNYTIWFWMTLQSKIFHDKKNCFIYTWFKVFLFFFRRKIWRKSRISKVGYWNLLPHSFDTPLLYRERKLNSYPVLPSINLFCIKKLEMKYTVCRDLKSDHESLVERHCIRGWINNPFTKKERTYSWKEKKKFPCHNSDLNEYLKILPR